MILESFIAAILIVAWCYIGFVWIEFAVENKRRGFSHRVPMLTWFVITIAAALTFCDSAKAQSAHPTHVLTLHSAAGESLDSFALRIAPEAVERSMALSAEICGEFHRVDDRYAIEFYTIGQLKACSYARKRGNNYTGMTYHTHVQVGVTDKRKREAALRNPRFSDEDYAHPGYMAMGDKVLHQVGRGTERRVR